MSHKPLPLLPDRETLLRLIRTWLDEDLGRGDLTSQLTVPADRPGKGRFVAREPLVIAGLPLIALVYQQLGSVVVVGWQDEGAKVGPQEVIAEVSGPARAILAGERLALNLIQHLSGIATLTRRYVEAIAGTDARVVDTRKTLPGLRLLEKYAVAVGGGTNHRFALDDGIMIKDNHIAAAGGLKQAVVAAKAGAPHLLKVEVEVDSLEQLDELLPLEVGAVLLDNMTPAQVRDAVGRVQRYPGPKPVIEASGGITLATIRGYADAGVDLISVGALTHSAKGVDIGLDIEA